MKKISIIFLACCCMVACKKEEKKDSIAKAEVKSYTIEQIMDNERVSGGSFSPDKSKLLITSNKSGIYNAYTVPTTGGEYTPITQSDSTSIRAVSYFPEDERMLLSMDGNGDEIYHIFLRNTDGKVTDLTPYKKQKLLFMDGQKTKKVSFLQVTKETQDVQIYMK